MLLTDQQIYTSETTKNEDNKFATLPVEVKNAIFKQLPLDADRACLALTCKDMAAAHQALVKEKNKKDYVDRVPQRATEVHRLQILVRLKKDMAPKRLCYKCIQFVDPNHPDFQGALWGGSEAAVQGLKATKAAMIQGPRCPLCAAAKKLEITQHKATYKEYLALADKFDLK